MRIKVKRLFTPIRELQDVSVTVENGRIVAIEKTKLRADRCYPIVAPAFVDSHTHGAAGIDVMNASVEEFLKLSSFYARHGVGRFFPTTVSDTFENLARVAETVKKVMQIKMPAAKIAGLYIEGPYLSPNKRGAHRQELLKEPDLEELEKFLSRYGDIVKVFTIAPELKGAEQAIKLLRRRGIIVSIAHTNATFNETLNAIKAGATRATHVFNAMREFNHREPGVVGAVLTHKKVYCEIICDLVHLHPATVQIVMKTKGSFKTLLITDSISATGLDDGVYKLGKMKVEVKHGMAKVHGQETLAGSTLTMDRAVKNLVFELGVPLRSAFIVSSFTPAKASGIEPNLLEEGMMADFVALDEELNLLAVYIDGLLVHGV
ncbi:N-acetylglucosamine-6-phosphate deacetylase [Thermotoga sp. Ku-13t]|uniref:N-acetylglucosamine-6-phosphate deacetylase n=1 Tax=Thermotoga sp. Ku-13t TaxID=1755813 RepID=UPI0013EDB884|nr:N-acetylglucosamine-6-phosphate deacetylase [Thermotoga sp. Ku-13t]KAF2958042.1 N-acetylglucosamine-6-phosphate deacetylase [Thermotoga sp. Ku-13t]